LYYLIGENQIVVTVWVPVNCAYRESRGVKPVIAQPGEVGHKDGYAGISQTVYYKPLVSLRFRRSVAGVREHYDCEAHSVGFESFGKCSDKRRRE
jgi:hypothetical protein